MSRIGKLPVAIPEGVTITIQDRTVKVVGPKGELSYDLLKGVQANVVEQEVIVTVDNEELKNLRGLTRSLIANMIEGVTNGYEKKLIVLWVGYSAQAQGGKLVLQLWLSHPVEHHLPESIKAAVEKDPKGNDMIVLQGIDKQLVGEQAAKIRSYRKPEPYKGKGIRYSNEYVKIKPGKTAAG